MIDAHHHFWCYDAEAFGWITDTMAKIRRDFLPTDLRAATAGTPFAGAVCVQARRCVEETDFLLDLAERHHELLGVVGWVDLNAEDVGDVLDRYAHRPLLRGVREVCQGEPDERYFTNDSFNRGIGEVTRRGLAYDVLIYEDQLPAATAFVDRHADQRFVVDHCAKPAIRRDRFAETWSRHLRELGRRPHVWCKLSGLVTEVRESGGVWDVALLRPYVETVLEAFGPGRVMFGSDWPVCLVATGYERWLAAVETMIEPLAPSERAAVLTENARGFYGLGRS